MAGTAIAAILGLAVAGHGRAAFGFGLGAAVAILNFRWLHYTIDALFSANQRKPSKASLAKFFVRYPLAFGGVCLVYRTHWLPFVAVMTGLFVPVVGVLIESMFHLRAALHAAK
jgi:hypothetical protein